MASRKQPKVPPPLLAGGSLIQLEKGLELLRELAAELQDDGPRQLWDDVKAVKRDVEKLGTSLDDRLGAFDKALEERCAASADIADDLNGEIQTLGTKLQTLVADQAAATTTNNDALAAQERAAALDMGSLRQ